MKSKVNIQMMRDIKNEDADDEEEVMKKPSMKMPVMNPEVIKKPSMEMPVHNPVVMDFIGVVKVTFVSLNCVATLRVYTVDTT